MSGELTYWVSDGADSLKRLRLTVLAEGDALNSGLQQRRREMLRRIIEEAGRQGARLSYRDLAMITLSSRATLKRDLSYLRQTGLIGPARGFRAA